MGLLTSRDDNDANKQEWQKKTSFIYLRQRSMQLSLFDVRAGTKVKSKYLPN